MRKTVLSILGVVALWTAPAFVWAQSRSPETPQQQAKYETSSGVVDSFGAENLIISDGAGQRMTFRVDKETMLPKTLQKGQAVRVDWKKGEGGERVAVAVTVVDKPTGLP
jgi:hypothetical protein